MGNGNRSNPIVESAPVKDWAQHVDMRMKEKQSPDYGLTDKLTAVPGDVINWGMLKLRTLGANAGGMGVGNGDFAYPDTTAQEIQKQYEANPSNEQLKQEWQDVLNRGRVNLLRSR